MIGDITATGIQALISELGFPIAMAVIFVVTILLIVRWLLAWVNRQYEDHRTDIKALTDRTMSIHEQSIIAINRVADTYETSMIKQELSNDKMLESQNKILQSQNQLVEKINGLSDSQEKILVYINGKKVVK